MRLEEIEEKIIYGISTREKGKEKGGKGETVPFNSLISL